MKISMMMEKKEYENVSLREKSLMKRREKINLTYLIKRMSIKFTVKI